MAAHAAARERAVLSDLRSALDLRDGPERGRRGRRAVTQLLCQGDAKVFKKCSQMKLQMKREAQQKINRTANESTGVLGQAG